MSQKKGAGYELVGDIDEVFSLLKKSTLSQGQQSNIEYLLQSLMVLQKDRRNSEPTAYVYEVELIEATSFNRNQIRYQIKGLTKLDLVTKVSIQEEGRRSFFLHKIGNTQSLEGEEGKGELVEPVEKTSLPSVENNGQLMMDFQAGQNLGTFPMKAEKFSVLSLLSALTLRHDKEAMKGRYRREVYINNELSLLEVASTVGTSPAVIKDLQTLIPVISILHAEAKRGNVIPNGELLLQVKDVVKARGLDDNGSNRINTIESIKRWNSTTFRFQNTSKTMQQHMGEIRVNDQFQILTRIQWIESITADGKERVPIAMKLTLANDLYARVISDEPLALVSVHREALIDKSPVGFLLYCWCRRAIQHNHQWRSFQADHMRRELWSYMSLKQSNQNLRRIFERGFSGSGEVSQPVEGYEMKVIPGGYAFRANWDDSLVGKQSFFALKNADKKKD